MSADERIARIERSLHACLGILETEAHLVTDLRHAERLTTIQRRIEARVLALGNLTADREIALDAGEPVTLLVRRCLYCGIEPVSFDCHPYCSQPCQDRAVLSTGVGR